MRQLSLRSLFGNTAEAGDAAPADALEVYDLFCGAGGFSEGARAAGCRVAFACDSDADALDTHARNHPHTTHLQRTLPCTLPLPTDGRRFHLHGSPPCQTFSHVNKNSRAAPDKESASSLMAWYLDLALTSQATSWSMEQVATPETLAVVRRAAKRHAREFAFGVFDLSALGVPQARKRLIAGSTCVLKRLRAQQLVHAANASPSIRRAIAKPRGSHVRAGRGWKRKQWTGDRYLYERASINDFCQPIDGVAPTVCGSHVLVWVNPSGMGGWSDRLTPRELSALQTFAPSYRWPDRRTVAYQQIGNAVPPLVAELMLRDA
jgi:DNA (cytosine-5)-methyltransferase 1